MPLVLFSWISILTLILYLPSTFGFYHSFLKNQYGSNRNLPSHPVNCVAWKSLLITMLNFSKSSR